MTFLTASVALVLATVLRPSAAAQQVLRIRYPRDIMWGSVLALSALWVLIQWAVLGGMAMEGETGLPNPGTQFMIYASILTILIFGFYFMGRIFGGEGTFPGTMVTVAWVFFVLTLVWPVTLALVWAMPATSSLFGWGLVALFAHTLAHFLNRLHGFDNLLTAGAVLLATLGALTLSCAAALWAMGLTIFIEPL